ncbi:spore cortex biosynthesis protein YabQ [Lachnospiraceae bacterium LCP25S3_G4]
MLGINGEVIIFGYAIITGAIVVGVYEVLRICRRFIAHQLWLIHMEDFIFWIGTAFFIFWQMFQTCNGEIRWFFLVGLIGGATICCALIKRIHHLIKK